MECYRKWENLNDISEVERVHGRRERVVVLPRKFWAGDWSGTCRERGTIAEDPIRIRGDRKSVV